MSALASLQQELQTHLLEDNDQILNRVTLPAKGTILERLEVYTNAYGWRLIDALQQEYGLLAKLLGEDAFIELAEAFIDVYPSQFYSIAEFSRPLAHFLAEYPPYSKQPYLSEIAQLIKALIVSLEAADTPFLNYEVLAKIAAQNWPSLCFKLHPSVQCLTFAWNSHAIWQALIQEKPLPRARLETSYCVVWRKQLQSYSLGLTEAEAIVLTALQAGCCFADVCQAVYDGGFMGETQSASFVANLIARWLDNHLFSEVYIS